MLSAGVWISCSNPILLTQNNLLFFNNFLLSQAFFRRAVSDGYLLLASLLISLLNQPHALLMPAVLTFILIFGSCKLHNGHFLLQLIE
jgi:hypothetical protein